jgi:ACT domain-containing protein
MHTKKAEANVCEAETLYKQGTVMVYEVVEKLDFSKSTYYPYLQHCGILISSDKIKTASAERNEMSGKRISFLLLQATSVRLRNLKCHFLRKLLN